MITEADLTQAAHDTIDALNRWRDAELAVADCFAAYQRAEAREMNLRNEYADQNASTST